MRVSDESEISSRKFMINIEIFSGDLSENLLFDVVCGPMIVLDIHDRGLDTGMHIEFSQHRLDVKFDSAVGNAQIAGDHLVALPFGHQYQDFTLAWG